MDIHVYIHESGHESQKIEKILSLLTTLFDKVVLMDANMQAAVDKLNAAVAEQTTVEASIEALLTGMAAQIKSLGAGVTDPVVLKAISDAADIVAANNAKAAAAVTANTVVA